MEITTHPITVITSKGHNKGSPQSGVGITIDGRYDVSPSVLTVMGGTAINQGVAHDSVSNPAILGNVGPFQRPGLSEPGGVGSEFTLFYVRSSQDYIGADGIVAAPWLNNAGHRYSVCVNRGLSNGVGTGMHLYHKQELAHIATTGKWNLMACDWVQPCILLNWLIGLSLWS